MQFVSTKKITFGKVFLGLFNFCVGSGDPIIDPSWGSMEYSEFSDNVLSCRFLFQIKLKNEPNTKSRKNN